MTASIRLCDCGIVSWVLLTCLTDCSWNLSFITLGGPLWLMNLFLPPKELPLDTKESWSCYRNDEISHKSPAGKRRAVKALNIDYIKNDSSILFCVSEFHLRTQQISITEKIRSWREKWPEMCVYFFLFVFNAKCLLVFEYWRLYYAHWTQRWLNQWDKRFSWMRRKITMSVWELSRPKERVIELLQNE